MDIITLSSVLEPPFEFLEWKYIISIGVFDGVHKGHKKVISSLVDYSMEIKKSDSKIKSAIFTFSKNPKDLPYIYSDMEIITKEEKYLIFEKLGIDLVFVIDFTEDIKKMSGKIFLDKLFSVFQVIGVFSGCDWQVGVRTDSVDTKLFKKLYPDIKLNIIDDQCIEGVRISSSIIRELIDKNGGKLSKTDEKKYF